MEPARQIGAGFKSTSSAALGTQHFESPRARPKRTHIPVFLFLVALVVPWILYLGALRMSVYRLVLSIMILPTLGMWAAGKAGRIRTADIAILLFAFWCVLGLLRIHGMSVAVQTSGIIFIETVGPYLLARCYVRDRDDFYNVVQLLFRIVVILMPFAVFEFVTGQNILRELFAIAFPTRTDTQPGRLGWTRVQSVFDHPILFGLFVGNLLSLVHLVLGYQKGVLQRALRITAVAVTALTSLSSGPLTALSTQAFLLSWNGAFSALKSRWKALIALVLSMYLVVELAANRSALQIFAGYFLLDPGSYWYRTWIFDYALRSAVNHPLFGVGLGAWERPVWMGDSIDNFWLYYAVHHGLPAVLLFLVACVSIFSSLGFKKDLDARLAEYRTGFLITLMAFFLVGCTVAFWDAAYVLFLFLMGSGVWMLDVSTPESAEVETMPIAHRASQTNTSAGRLRRVSNERQLDASSRRRRPRVL
jgi:hypothetical protein